MSTLADQSFAAPAMRLSGAAAAYGAVIRGTAPPRDIECRILARLIGLLEDAQAPEAGPAALHEAAHETRMVWTAMLMDLVDPGNRWDDVGKARLVSLARWIILETDRVQRRQASPETLIAVIRPVMEGLKAAAMREAAQG